MVSSRLPKSWWVELPNTNAWWEVAGTQCNSQGMPPSEKDKLNSQVFHKKISINQRPLNSKFIWASYSSRFGYLYMFVNL